MAIVKMSDFSLFAFDSERNSLLHELQKFEYVHFSDLDKDETLKEEGLRGITIPPGVVTVDEDLTKVKYVLEHLSQHDTREKGIKGMIQGKTTLSFTELEEAASGYDFRPVYNDLKENMQKIDALNQEELRLIAEVEELKPWTGLNYPVKDMVGFEQSELFTGTVPKKLKDKLISELSPFEFTYHEVVSEGKDEAYILLISSKQEREALMEVLRNNSYSALRISGTMNPEEEILHIKDQLKTVKSNRSELREKVKSLSVHLSDFEVYYEYLMNNKLRLHASENFLMTESVNVIRGYIPTEMKEEFTEAVSRSLKNAFYLDIKDSNVDDNDVPVLLKNSKMNSSFESLTTMYALPQYNEIDPTPLFAPFYLIFFGMMVADVGYGVILLLGTLGALKFAKLAPVQEKFVRFFFYLSFSTIAWGFIYGSVFGDLFPNMWRLVDPATDYMILLVVSIIFGAIHIFFALGIKAYMYIRNKDYVGAMFDVGFWYMAIAGGIGFLLTMLMPVPAILKTVSLVVMAAGMVGIVVTGGRENKSVFGKAAGGLYSLYSISGYVGDFVSYSRLMALGLAGGFIAVAINMMVKMVSGMGILGIAFGLVIFVGGQAFNLFLSLLSAYVHTSRLTYVEFFGKFYVGGGHEFKSFKNKSKYINLT